MLSPKFSHIAGCKNIPDEYLMNTSVGNQPKIKYYVTSVLSGVTIIQIIICYIMKTTDGIFLRKFERLFGIMEPNKNV